MSAIVAIYDAIEAMAPTHKAGVTVPCRDLNEYIETGVKSGDMPLRILMLPDSSTFDFTTLGTHAQTTWTLLDRFFYKPVAQGEGIRKAAFHLRAYMVSYIAAIRAGKAPTAQSGIQSATFTPRFDIEWPEGSGVKCFGVDTLLTIMEHITT